MLFEEDKFVVKVETRPTLPKGTPIDYELGFLFNFIAGKSTRFDLEPILIQKKEKTIEYKRISIQSEKGLAYLQPLEESLYNDLIQFSDNKILNWMSATGNRFIRNSNTGNWSHKSAKELINLRRHYRDLLEKLWPALSTWPNVFLLGSGRFNNTQQFSCLHSFPSEEEVHSCCGRITSCSDRVRDHVQS